MRAFRLVLGAGTLAAGLSLAAPQEAQANCNWTVKGRLSVKHRDVMQELGSVSDLENVQVKVSAMSKVAGVWSGKWGSWGTVRTDSAGNFSVSQSKGCGDRRFRVKVKFDDSDLEVRHEKATSSTTKVKWYTVINDVQRSSGTYDIGRRYFDGVSAHDLKDFEAWSHASIWVLYKKAIDRMKKMGPDFAFTTKIKVKYPHDGVAGNAAEESYANPTTKVIYIVKNSAPKDRLEPSTLLHELGHIWAYNHSQGEICLTEALVTTQNTHGIVDDHCVAFHEGFAEWWSEEMRRELLGTAMPLPKGRGWLANRGAGTLSKVQRFDDGWTSVFRTLRLEDIQRYDFNTSGDVETRTHLVGTCDLPKLGFKNVLNVFNASAAAGYDKKLVRNDTTIDAFLTRVTAIAAKFKTDHKSAYKKLVNPQRNEQPGALLCNEPTVTPITPNLSKPRIRK